MPRKIGEAAADHYPGKRYSLNMRTTKVVRDQLTAAANASGRSLTQEVEYRLQRSLELDEIAGSVGWHDTFWLMQMVAYLCDWMERDSGKPWDHDEDSRRKMIELLHPVFQSLLLGAPDDYPDGAELGRALGYISMRNFVRVAADIVKDRSAWFKRKPQVVPLP